MNKKINVLFDATILENGVAKSAARSGIYFVAYNILLELIKRDEFNIELYCAPDKLHKIQEFIKADENLCKLKVAEYSKLDNLLSHWEFLKYKNKKNKENKIIRVGIKTILNCIKFIHENKYKFNKNNEYQILYKDFDIFFSPFEAIPRDIKNIDHIKKYTILYDLMPILFPEFYPGMKSKDFWYNKLLTSLNKEDQYFAISEYTKQDFIKHIEDINSEHITTIPLSTGLKYERVNEQSKIDAVREKYKIPQGKKYLFSLCTLEPRKNLIFAVKNFIEFIHRNNIDDFVFVLGGAHWDIFIQKLNEAIDDAEKYKDKIIKIGYVDDEDMSSLYSGAEMFVFPSIYEGFGMPILEAMQCGCPVITSNVTSMPEVLGDCGIQINPQDNEDLINAFHKMYFDKKFREECINNGLERAKEFTWEKCADVITNNILKISKPIVTVITITYNLIKNNRREQFIQMLESVQNQTYDNIEHIVVDGASNDGTVDLIKEYADKGWINYISEPDTGLYDAMNKGGNLAKGKYILFLHSDDYFSGQEGIEKSIEALEKSNADYSCAQAIILNEAGVRILPHPHSDVDFSHIFVEMPFCHQTMLVKTEIFRKLGMFDLQYKSAADYDFTLKLFFNNYKHVYVPYEFVTFRLGGYSFENLDMAINEVASFYHKYYNKFWSVSLSECKNIYVLKYIPIKLLLRLLSFLSFKNKFKLIRSHMKSYKSLLIDFRRKLFRIRFSKTNPCFEIFGLKII